MKLPAEPIVYCISEGRANSENFREVRDDILEKIKNAADRGVNMFQIREKVLSADLLYDLTIGAVSAAGESVRVLVNDRADIAMAAGAAGVHLPSRGLPARELRKHVPADMLIAVSTHSLEEVKAAKDDGADLVTFGPIFASPGKGDGVGIAALAEICSASGDLPVVALGGIDGGRINEVLRGGAFGFAAIRYLNELLS